MLREPSEDAPVVSQAIFGANLETLEERDDWLQVRTVDSYSGWVPRVSVRKLGARAYASQGAVAIVHSLFANLYREPDVTKRRPLATIPFESRLEVVDPDADGDVWVRVRLPDATTAFIHRGSVTFDDRPLPVEEVTVLARQFVGLPYLWGGVSTFGFDCSGLTQMLCRRRNILIPRDAQPQANWEGMLAVTRDSLEPGDLLYFGPSSGRITHTGYYLGGGEFIHATTHIRPMVQISRLDEPHWSALLVACRRPRMEAPR